MSPSFKLANLLFLMNRSGSLAVLRSWGAFSQEDQATPECALFHSQVVLEILSQETQNMMANETKNWI